MNLLSLSYIFFICYTKMYSIALKIGHKSSSPEALGGNLVREVRETRHFNGLLPYLVRRYDYPRYVKPYLYYPLSNFTFPKESLNI